ncbi:cAMP/cGMP-dependent 3',5'-cyclic-AMP/GMP phosphodiesterase [Leptospira sp. 85282-16]|uniref:cAMP/cGMP-dependent 3',5'-cyclic-AMP/GMP phosphodiesterase n=1 Tax=Leptospira sp. 85282-16 TaxID=2971256 RepID=UPI0021BEEC1D|nr:cAMP/cGMP-dependent 3',5'-cyclic-AMP/GMP phosphodiesterase [Leptospira sp. 85282-16]MCT8335030.1 cAMP/cGMP-dependent 3',5'-cyclic-AMP/GMP phosphodiesterase [Leptospira sp. 85282-16]
MVSSEPNGFTALPRGGYLVDTSEGYIQIGSPPETIKDTMGLEKKTPLVFVLPNKFFHVEKGISIAELEFPIYFNFFFRGGKKTFIVCSPEQKEQLTIVLGESLMGPQELNLASEFIDGTTSFGFPDIKAEMAYFRSYKTMEEVVEFILFDENHKAQFGKITIEQLPSNEFLIVDGDKKIKTPGEVDFHVKYDIGKRLEEPFQPPIIGITCLGPSHGFDPTDNTSGFIIWLNGQGIMVDPPVNSTEWLRESNVNPKFINSIILTHCHADHDAGTFQKILEESKITIYATATVMESFLKKYCSLTKIPRKEITDLFDFIPVVIGRPTIINGGEFYFHYALHSIPSVGFEFFFQDQSFYYTSDHLNDPEAFEEMYKKGVFPESRYQFLKDFPWDRKIIYHEAGVPPLHTKISYLASLPEEVQKRITVYHIAAKDMPEGNHLTLAKFGIENTLYPEITPPKHQEAFQLLEILSQIDIFSGFPIEKAKEFLQIVKEERFRRGEQIIKKGTHGDRFFIIASGNVRFEGLSGDPSAVKRYGTYEYFGEASLILDTARQADVFAETDVLALTIEKTRFFQFIRGSKLHENLTKLNSIRETNTWKTLTESQTFRGLTSYQVTQLELILKLETVKKEASLIEEGHTFHNAFIVRSGTVVVMQNHKTIRELGPGDFVGEIYSLTKNLPSNFSFVAWPGTELYVLSEEDAIQYIKKNPGVYMKLNTVYN